MSNYISMGKMKEAENFMPKFHSQLMKIVKTGAIKKRTASRKISRVAKKIKNSKKQMWKCQFRVDVFLIQFIDVTK